VAVEVRQRDEPGRPARVASSRWRRASTRGLSLIEIIVVVGIMAVVIGIAVAGTQQLPSAKLRRSATMIASAIKVAYTRATATSRDLRLVLDIDAKKVWLEESDAPMLVQAKDKTGTGGADPITKAEQTAVEEGKKIMNGPPIPKPRFHPIGVYGFGDDVGTGKGGKPLHPGITLRSVQTGHDDAPRTSGRAYVYFWPGGRTEYAAIQVRIGDSPDDDRTLTLLLAPLTGKVTIKGGPVELKLPVDDATASDRTDTTW
jgi:general secretion pathway protein H